MRRPQLRERTQLTCIVGSGVAKVSSLRAAAARRSSSIRRPPRLPSGSPKRKRGECVRYTNRLSATTTVATWIPIACAPGFLWASNTMRYDPQCLPSRSHMRKRGECRYHTAPLLLRQMRSKISASTRQGDSLAGGRHSRQRCLSHASRQAIQASGVTGVRASADRPAATAPPASGMSAYAAVASSAAASR